jgi:hypothetical protein
VGFNLNNGEVPFPPINIDISGDVDLNTLINEIIKLIELKRKFLIEFIDMDNLIETNDKIKLVMETLNGVYSKFNENVEIIDNIENDGF